MPHAIYFLMFAVVATLATISLVKGAKASQSYNTVVADDAAESDSRTTNVAVEDHQRRQRTRGHCVSASSGRAIAVEVLGINANGTLKLRRRGHLRAMPFTRPASAMFSR